MFYKFLYLFQFSIIFILKEKFKLVNIFVKLFENLQILYSYSVIFEIFLNLLRYFYICRIFKIYLFIF